MNYDDLKSIPRLDAIRRVLPEGQEMTDKITTVFPYFSDVIIFGGDYWRSNQSIADFINEFMQPANDYEIIQFLQEMVYRIVTDPALSSADSRKYIHVDYQLLYKQHYSLYKSPDALFDWAEAKGTFLWFEFTLSERRKEQFKRIIKAHDEDALFRISRRIKKIYGFTDREVTYLQYFCSQAKLDNLDSSLNTFLYLWSQEKFTGKTTVSEYICSFLNGENRKNADAHKSDLSREMQIGSRFDIPNATVSRCTMLDEAGFYDMTKTYDKLKSMTTNNSCEIEYKYRSSKRPKRCYRNYIMSSNNDPIYFVKDDSERRILPIHFKKPERVSFEELEKIWYEFVFECNFSVSRLTEIYENVIHPNSQAGEYQNIISELRDLMTPERVLNCNSGKSYFSISNVMTFSEIRDQRNIDRKMVKEALISLYGKPDNSQRFYKINRQLMDGEDIRDGTLPF
jgi:hypothetical protein